MIESLKAKLAGAWKSWTIWVNGVLLVLIPMLPALTDALPQLQPYVPPDFYKWAMLVVLVANLALRFKTTTALGEK